MGKRRAGYTCESNDFALTQPLVVRGAAYLDLVHILNPEGLRLLHKRCVEVGSIPVRIGDAVVRAGGHKQLIQSLWIRRIRDAQAMMIEGEATL